jgi:hypothetical protein
MTPSPAPSSRSLGTRIAPALALGAALGIGLLLAGFVVSTFEYELR